MHIFQWKIHKIKIRLKKVYEFTKKMCAIDSSFVQTNKFAIFGNKIAKNR